MKHPLPLLAWFLCLLASATPATASAQHLQWEPRQDLNVLLPKSVQLYEGNGKLADGARVRAVYAKVDLRDPNLKLRAVGNNTGRQTTQEAYQQHNGILAINGGYFSASASVSVLVSDGETVAPGPKGKVTRGAFGLVNGKPEITWPYAVGVENILYKYLRPNASDQPEPTATSPKGAQRWMPSQAVGGGPVLVKAGKLSNTSKEEGFGGSHLARHPRTAIGYLDENTLLMMVVDGRQQASAGVTLDELARMMLERGCVEALNLDGGGSSAMVAADEVVNIPTDVPNGNRYSLRRNASALVLSQLAPAANKEIVYLDTDSRHYTETGLWRESNHANYYGSTPSRLASANQKYNKATYAFAGIKRGRYQLASWWTVNTDANTTHATYVLHHSNKADTLSRDQASLSTSGKWNVLGDFILGPGDYLELLGNGKEGKLVADAVRLVAHEALPAQPAGRGDLRIAVISDLNSGVGAATYEWQVDSILQRIPRLWQPDLVICSGDMVAGMGVKDTATLTKMWAGFDKHIVQPLRKSNIPFAFTLGNHDGPRSLPLEQQAAAAYWNKPGSHTGLQFVDRSHFPFYYSFVKDDVFFVSWEASSSEITEANLAWMAEQFARPEAQKAKLRFVMGHMPLYSVAQERDSKGNVLENPEKLRTLLQQYNVHTYISGHHHAYYPGKRGKLELFNTGAAGAGPRGWLTLDNPPQNTITIMDIFHDKDSIAYTTYDIKQKAAKDMFILDDKVLPTAIFGVNGHLLRRDLEVTGEASGTFSSFNQPGESKAPGSGSVTAQVKGNKLIIRGNFAHLDGKPTSIGLYQGRNAEAGTLLQPLKAKGKRKGTFQGALELTEELPELMAVGALYVQLNTDKYPEGALRTQLYPAYNQAPAAPRFTLHNNRNTYAVRNIQALYQLKWEKAQDPEGDFVSYTYQLATDEQFRQVLWHKNTGRVTYLKMLEQDWYQLLGDAAEGVPVTFYHRVIATDGRNVTYGPATELRLLKSHEPLEDFIEVPAPNYVFAGKVENAPGAGYGAQWDKDGKLWLATFGGTLLIKNPDGSDAPFSPLTSVTIKGEKYTLNPLNGISVDLEGNILIGRNRHLLKINARTGEGMAVWEVPQGMRAITAPRVNEKGEIYAMALFAEDQNYVLKPSATDPAAFELVRTLTLPDRILARTFAMTPDGLTLYFPSPGSPYIQKYNSKDGNAYTKEEDISSTAAGSNALQVGPNNTLYAAVRASGVVPSTFHFRDDAKKVMWTLPLPEVGGAEARGIGVSPDGRTLIFCSWDNGGGFYRYVLQDDAGSANQSGTSAEGK